MASKTLNNTVLKVTHKDYSKDTTAASALHLTSGENIAHSLGKIEKWHSSFNSVVWDGNAAKVNSHTVDKDVPSTAIFSVMTGATSAANGTAGYVPAPAAGKQSAFLRGDGTWATPTNTYDRLNYKQNVLAKSAIVASNIIVANDNTGYFHLKTGNQFDITYPILFASAAIAASANATNTYISFPVIIATTQSLTMTAQKPVFIKGTLSGTKFTPVSATPLTQTIPTAATDTYEYLLLGYANSSTVMYLTEDHPIYAFRGGSFSKINGNEITGLSVSGKTVTYTRGDGTTGTITTQDTTYSAEKGITLASGKFGHSNTAVTAVTTAALKKVAYDAYGHITATSDVAKADITGLGIPGSDTTYGAEKGISLTSGKFGHSNTAVTAVTTAGLYKVKYDAYGHITGTTAVAKADITGLGIPGSDTNTTYTLSGAYGTNSNTWVTTLTPSSGTATTSTVPTASTSVYGITKLSSATNSTSTALAATASAVKSAYDLASGKSTVSISRSLTSGTKIGTITIDGTATDLYCQTNTNTDTKVQVDNTTPTTATNYYPTFVSSSVTTGSAVTEGYSTGLLYKIAEGSTTVAGGATFYVGTATKGDVAGNKAGRIIVRYSSGKSDATTAPTDGWALLQGAHYTSGRVSSLITDYPGDANGDAVAYNGGGGLTVIGGGESATNYLALAPKIRVYYDSSAKKIYSDSAKTKEITPVYGSVYQDITTDTMYKYTGSYATTTEDVRIETNGAEELLLTADASIRFYTNCNTIASRTMNLIDADGNFKPYKPFEHYVGTVGNPFLSMVSNNFNAMRNGTVGNFISYNARINGTDVSFGAVNLNTLGTTSTKGIIYHTIGNNIATGTANNACGILRLYSEGSKYIDTYAVSGSANVSIGIPPVSGRYLIQEKIGTYWGVMDGDGSATQWMRTTKNGLLPYAANSDTTNGNVSSLGTSTWTFKDVWANNIGAKTVVAHTAETTETNTIDNVTGSGFFQGNKLLGDTYDWVGIQAYSGADKWQLMGESNHLMYRQNDTGGSNTSAWSAWNRLLQADDFSVEATAPTVTVTKTTTTFGTGTDAFTYNSGVKISHTAANVSNMINLLTTGSSAPGDDDYYVSQYANGGTTTTTYHRRPMSALWTYIKSKIDAAGYKTTDTTYGAEKGISLTSGKFGHSNAAVTAVTTAGLYKVKYDAYGHITGTTAIAKADITGLGIPASDTTYGAEKGITLASGKFGHSNTAVTAVTTAGLYKVKYDAYGHITGTTAVAKADITGLGIPSSDTTYGAEKGITLASGKFGHSNTAVTAVTTAGLYKVKYDAYGHITGTTAVAKADITALGIPGSDTNTDTKVNVTLATTTKAYLLATSTTPTATATAVTSVADTGVYLDTAASSLSVGALYVRGGTGIVGKDSNDSHDFTLISHNATNVWVGAGGSTSYHHKGETFISTGWTGTLPTSAGTLDGNATIRISVPKYTVASGATTGTWSATNYYAIHSGNYTSYITPANIGAATASHTHAYIPMAGSTEVTGDIQTNATNTAIRQFRAKNSVGDVALYVATSGNQGVYSHTGGHWIINYNPTEGQTQVRSNTWKPETDGTNTGYLALPLFANAAGSGTKSLVNNDGFNYELNNGTTTVNGAARLVLGNSTASGTANNKSGVLRLFSTSQYYANITPATLTASRTITLPDATGTVALVGHVAFTRSLTSGTKIGTITIDGTATDLYCQTNTNTDTNVTQSVSTTSNYRPLLSGATNVATAQTGLDATVTGQSYVNNRFFVQPSSGTLYAGNLSAYDKNGGNTSIELWRGTNRSWQILNTAGQLQIKTNYAYNTSTKAWAITTDGAYTTMPLKIDVVSNSAIPQLTMNGRIITPGYSASWWNGRDTASLTLQSNSAYCPVFSTITKDNGSWEIGNHNNEKLCLTYISSDQYTAGTNPTGTDLKQIIFGEDGTITATASSDGFKVSGATGRKYYYSSDGMQIYGANGNWVGGIRCFGYNATTQLGFIGAYGTATTCDYFSIGATYTNYALKIMNDGTGKTIIRGTTPQIQFVNTTTDKNYTASGIWADAASVNGVNLYMQGGGNTIIGSGESPTNFKNATKRTEDAWSDGGETMYITSDGSVNIYSNCNTIDNRYRLQFSNAANLWIPSNGAYGWSANANGYNASLKPATLTASRTWTIMDRSGTIPVLKRGRIYDDSADHETGSFVWYKIASCAVAANYEDKTAHFYISRNYSTQFAYAGILAIHFRTKNGGGCESYDLGWVHATNSINPADWVIAYKTDESVTPNNLTVELWCRAAARYAGWSYEVISEHDRREFNDNVWTLYSYNGHGQTSYPTYATEKGNAKESVFSNLKNNLSLTPITCSTAAATADKVISCPGLNLTSGVMLVVKFTNTNTATVPRLKVNDELPYNIYFRNTGAKDALLADQEVLLVFDGTFWRVIGGYRKTIYSTATTASTATGTYYVSFHTTNSSAEKSLRNAADFAYVHTQEALTSSITPRYGTLTLGASGTSTTGRIKMYNSISAKSAYIRPNFNASKDVVLDTPEESGVLALRDEITATHRLLWKAASTSVSDMRIAGGSSGGIPVADLKINNVSLTHLTDMDSYDVIIYALGGFHHLSYIYPVQGSQKRLIVGGAAPAIQTPTNTGTIVWSCNVGTIDDKIAVVGAARAISNSDSTTIATKTMTSETIYIYAVYGRNFRQ